MRYATAASLAKLARRFGLPHDPWMQDWEVEVADFSRVPEFLAGFAGDDLDQDDRFLLMGLVVASLDDGVHLGTPFDTLWREAERLMRGDLRLHASTLSYWACGDEPDPEHQFAITPFVRPLWRELLASLRACGSGER